MGKSLLCRIKTQFTVYACLLRWINLLMILLIVLIIRYGFFLPLYMAIGLASPLSHTIYFLVVLSIVLITAAGYIVNDIYDQKIDRLNKPTRLVIGQAVSVSRGWILYVALNIFGLISGGIAALQIEQPMLLWLFVLSFGLLWYYSAYLKRKPFWGNFLVSFLSALVIITPWLFEFYALLLKPDEWIAFYRFYPHVNYIILSLSIFAFISTLIREIIKDAEDMEGDQTYECQTLPIILGWKTTHRILQALIALMMILLAMAQYWLRSHHYNLAFYRYFTVQFLSIRLLTVLPADVNKNQLHRCSSLAKITMLAGILGILALIPPLFST